MGADSVWVYYGVKRDVGADSDELKLLETEKHPIFDRAFDAKLHVGWGRLTDGEDYFLLIGHQIGRFGVEGEHQRAIAPQELQHIIQHTDERLKQAGFSEPAALICQLDAQY